jgi:hypothetical protein
VLWAGVTGAVAVDMSEVPRRPRRDHPAATSASDLPRVYQWLPGARKRLCADPYPRETVLPAPISPQPPKKREKRDCNGGRAPNRAAEHPRRGRQPLEFTQRRAVLDMAKSPTAAESTPSANGLERRRIARVDAVPAELLLD